MTERGRDGQTERYMRGRESEVAPGIKAAEPRMTTERMGEGWREKGKEREREREGGRASGMATDTDRQTDSEALKFMAFFIFRAENQYCLLWMR